MNSLIKFIVSTHSADMWLKLALLLVCILFLMKRKRINEISNYEGFHQTEPFILKSGNAIYDDFYVSVYDTINTNLVLLDGLVDSIIKNTQMDVSLTNKSAQGVDFIGQGYKVCNVLCMNSKTGDVCDLFKKRNLECVGVDMCDKMVEYAKYKYPSNTFMLMSNDPLYFDEKVFSHVVCLEMGYYEIAKYGNKYQMLLNIHKWLKNGGYFVVHLVDMKKYDIGMRMLLNNGEIAVEPLLEKSGSKYSKVVVDYGDFEYKNEFSYGDKCVLKKEMFVDKKTKCIRQNEMEYEMESLDKSILFIESCGFSQKGKYKYLDENKDSGEFIYVFQKMDVVDFV